MGQRPPRVLIYSAAVRLGGGVDLNLGDEALSDCLAAGIRARMGEVNVRRLVKVLGHGVQLDPDERELGSPASLVSEIRWADVVVLGGGTLLQDDPGLLRWQALIATLARAFGKPVVVAAVGAEGLSRARFRRPARYICRRATAITVRDRASSEVLRRVSGRGAEIAADPVLLTHSLLAPLALAAVAPAWIPAGSFLAVNLTREAPPSLIDALAERSRAALAAGASVVGVAMDRRSDRDTLALRRLGEALGQPAGYRLLPPRANWRQVCSVLAGAQVCVGMRLHFMLLASIASAPLVAITTLPKTVAFAEELGVARVAGDASGDELGEAMEHAHAPPAEALQALAARAELALERVAFATRL